MRIANWIASVPNRRGLIMDAMVLVTNLFLVGPLTRLVRHMGESFTNNQANASPTLGWLLAAVFVAYTLGAYLKRWPLQVRMARQPAAPEKGFLGCVYHLGPFFVLTLHVTLFLLMTIFIAADYQMEEFRGDVCLMIVVACVPTLMTIRALMPPKDLSKESWRKFWGVELLADLALYFSALVIMVIWNLASASILTNSPPVSGAGDFFGRIVMMVLIVTPMFVMFYIAPRILYLAEDYRYPRTWVMIMLAMLPAAMRVVFGAEAHW